MPSRTSERQPKKCSGHPVQKYTVAMHLNVKISIFHIETIRLEDYNLGYHRALSTPPSTPSLIKTSIGNELLQVFLKMPALHLHDVS